MAKKRFSIWRMEFLHPAAQCSMWLWYRDSAFTKWQHPALWYLALGWHMPLNSPKRPPYWISTSGFDFDHITAVDMSFYISVRNFIQIGPPSAEKMTSCWFSRWRISAILDFRHQIMGSLRSPCTTSYRSSIETIALNCLVFEKIAFFAFRRQTDRQTDKLTDELTDGQTDGQLRWTKPLSLLRAAA